VPIELIPSRAVYHVHRKFIAYALPQLIRFGVLTLRPEDIPFSRHPLRFRRIVHAVFQGHPTFPVAPAVSVTNTPSGGSSVDILALHFGHLGSSRYAWHVRQYHVMISMILSG
jgi:hypothetical protein